MSSPHSFRLLPAALLALGLTLLPSMALADSVWEIDTYGNGALLKTVFEAIAAFADTQGGLASATTLAGLIALIGALIGAIGAVLTGGGSALALFPFTIVVAGIVGTFSTFPATVALIDKVDPSANAIISGVPTPIAVIGHFTSVLGARLTEQIEQAIQPVEIERFSVTGLGWGPRVIQAALEAKPLDQALINDLDAFIRLCLIPDIATDFKTVKQVTEAKTADDLLSGTNPAISVLLPSQCNDSGLPDGCSLPPSADQRCPDAYNGYLAQQLTDAAADPDFLKTIAPQIGTPYTQVVQSVGDVSNDLLQVSQNGAELLKLRFVVNQLLPSVQASAALAGQTPLLTAWSLAEAQSQQTSSWLTIGLLLQQTLPVFHAALEFLFYAFMLFGLPLLVLRPHLFIEMIGTALWLQLWPLAYVFGNLFLYAQLNKVNFMTSASEMDLGLSYTTTQPLQSTIQSAYAASGFPVMLAIMMIGGMIFGGGFALTKAIAAGPFTAGGGFGTGAALGNINQGNVQSEQRNVVPETRQYGHGPTVEEAIERTVGSSGRYQSQMFTTASGTFETIQGGESSSGGAVLNTLGNTAQVTSNPRTGTTVSDSQMSFHKVQQDTAAKEAAFSSAKANREQSEGRLGVSINDATNRALALTEKSALDRGSGETSDVRTTLQHAVGQSAERALRESHTFDNALEQANQHGVTLSAGGAGGAGLGFLRFNIGGNGEVTARDARTGREAFRLEGQDAKNFNESFTRNLARNDTAQRSLTSLQGAAKQKGINVELGEMHQAQRSLAISQSDERQASDSLRNTQSIGQMLQKNQLADFFAHAYNKEDPKAFGNDFTSTDPNRRSAAIEFANEEFKTIREGGPEFTEQFKEFQEAHPSQESQAIQAEILLGGLSLDGVQNAPPGPRTQEQFQEQTFGGDPKGPDVKRTQIVKDRVDLGITDKEFKTIERKTDTAEQQAGQVPSTETLKGHLDKGETRKPHALQERTLGVQGVEATKEVGHQVYETGKQVVNAVKEAFTGDDTPKPPSQAPGPTPQKQ